MMVFNNHDIINNHDVLRKIIMMLKFTQSLTPSKDTWHTHIMIYWPTCCIAGR